MKVTLSGRAGTRSCDWGSYALLRDNVQHFIEFGEPRDQFRALHDIEKAVDQGGCAVDAASLRGEVLRAWYALWKVSLDDAAVSLRTRAVLTGSSGEPAVRGTVPARLAGWQLPVEVHGAFPVPEAARPFVVAVLELTEDAVDGDLLEVRREGGPPRFAESLPAPSVDGTRTRDLRRLLRRFSTTALVSFAVACSAATPEPRWAPGPPVERAPTTELDEENLDTNEPVVAPPPAYGNKVVHDADACPKGERLPPATPSSASAVWVGAHFRPNAADRRRKMNHRDHLNCRRSALSLAFAHG